jgi:hypothetical protein
MSEILTVRLGRDEARAVRLYAALEGVTVSAAMRRILTERTAPVAAHASALAVR